LKSFTSSLAQETPLRSALRRSRGKTQDFET
jgi:hypothetical protein